MIQNATPKERALTPRGAATKRRIVAAAAELIHAKGAERLSLDEVMEESRVSKSQLYHYFGNKEALVSAVIEFQSIRILDSQSLHLQRVDSFAGLRAWCNAVVAANNIGGGVGGCPLGSLANELAAHSEDARLQLDRSFASWSKLIEAGLSQMRKNKTIKASADPAALAQAMLAAIQGGLLLSKTARHSKPLEVALDMALMHIGHYAS
jgi:TetR/AcrR family transcriptional repressor of nem operon